MNTGRTACQALAVTVLATGCVLPPIGTADDPAQRVRENLVQVLLSHNDFITIR